METGEQEAILISGYDCGKSLAEQFHQFDLLEQTGGHGLARSDIVHTRCRKDNIIAGFWNRIQKTAQVRGRPSRIGDQFPMRP